jgi:hypothetical protein
MNCGKLEVVFFSIVKAHTFFVDEIHDRHNIVWAFQKSGNGFQYPP